MSSAHHPHQFVAHRGLQVHFPENTIVGIEAAIAAGALHVEVDVQFSKDGVPMLYHDDVLTRISGGVGRVDELSSAELLQMPAHEPERLGQAFAHNLIAPLSALVGVAQQHPQVHFYIEFKEESLVRFSRDFCLAAIHQVLIAVMPQMTLISFDALAVNAAALQHGFPRAGIVLVDWATREQVIHDSGASIAYINLKRIPAEAMISASCPIVVYEIADVELAQQTLARGAAKIESFAVDKLIASLCE